MNFKGLLQNFSVCGSPYIFIFANILQTETDMAIKCIYAHVISTDCAILRFLV